MFQSVLLLAPHQDDGELGAGGLVAKLSDEGSYITYIGFYAPPELRNEVNESAEILGIDEVRLLDFERRTFPSHRQEILQFLYDYNEKYHVDLVLTPATTDIHQDHQTVTNEAIRAFRRSTILGYEVPGNNVELHQNCFILLNEDQVKRKVKAVLCYESQFENRRIKFTEEYTRSRIINCGVHVNNRYAERFEVIKLVIM